VGDTGREGEVAGQDLVADLLALEGDGELLRDGEHVGLDGDGVGVLDVLGARGRLALDDDGDVDLDGLVAFHGEQVGVVDVEGQDVLVDGLDEGEVLLTVDVDVDQGVDAVVTQDALELEQVEADVDRLLVVGVDDGRDAPGATQAAGGTLTELGARLGGDVDDLGGHVALRFCFWSGRLTGTTTFGLSCGQERLREMTEAAAWAAAFSPRVLS